MHLNININTKHRMGVEEGREERWEERREERRMSEVIGILSRSFDEKI